MHLLSNSCVLVRFFVAFPKEACHQNTVNRVRRVATMSQNNELNESEMDQLLRELEQKASSKPKEAKGEEAQTRTQKASKEVVEKKKTSPPTSKKSNAVDPVAPEKATKTKGISIVQRGGSESLNRKVSTFIFFLTTPILLAAIWMLGNYLASFVSVGWLIAIVATVGVLGCSYFFKRAVSKGRFMVWNGLVSLLLLVAMLLPTNFATTKMIEFGHWPISSIAEAAGMDKENTFTSFSNRISKTLADFRSGLGESDLVAAFPKTLGTDLPLFIALESKNVEPQPGGTEAEKPKAVAPSEKTRVDAPAPSEKTRVDAPKVEELEVVAPIEQPEGKKTDEETKTDIPKIEKKEAEKIFAPTQDGFQPKQN